MSANKNHKVVRPLAYIERWQTAMYTLGAYYGTTVSCRYRIPPNITGADRRDDLKAFFDRAVTRTVLQHPFLRVGLADETENTPNWIEIDGLDLGRHIQWHEASEGSDEAKYRSVHGNWLDVKFGDLETVPGWKLALFVHEEEGEVEALFAWNHVNADGMSGKIFHHTLLKYLNEPATATIELPLENRFVKATATADDVPPGQHDIANYTISAWFLGGLMWREAIWPTITGDQSSKALWSPVSLTPYETRYAAAIVPPAPLSKVLEKCRAHNTTLTGLLHGIALLFFAKLLGPDKATAFTSQTPLDMRRHTPANSDKFPDLVPAETMANYISIVMHGHDAALLTKIRALDGGSGPDGHDADTLATLDEVIWSTASRVRGNIQTQLDKGTGDDFTGMMKLIPDFRAHFKKEVQKPRAATWLVSNIGVLDNPPAGDWSATRATFSLSSMVHGPVCKLCPMSVKGGDLAVNVTWQKGVVEDETGQRLAKEIDDWLNRFAEA